MLIQLKNPLVFERADGSLVKKETHSSVNYSCFKIEPDEWQHIVTTNDPRTGGRLTDVQRLPTNVRPAYL